MFKFDKNFVIVEAVKAAYKVVREEMVEAKHLANSRFKVTDEGNIDLFFESEELSFFLKVDYDSSVIPDRVQEIFPCPRVFANGITKVTVVRCDIKMGDELSISCRNMEIESKSCGNIVEPIVLLTNELFSREFGHPISECKLITGKFLLTYYEDNEFFKERFPFGIYDKYGHRVTWGEEEINGCFAEGSEWMREYEGFLLLDSERGFHIEAEALYNESDYESVENMF